MSFTSPSSRTATVQDGRRAAAVWCAAWGLMIAAGAGVMLAVLGSAEPTTLAALALAAAPGALNAFWRPRSAAGRGWALTLWALATAVAAALTGGVTGPLAVWLLAPILAAGAWGGLWRPAASRAFAAFVAVAVLEAGHRTAAAPDGATSFALALIALATALATGAAALMILSLAQSTAGIVDPALQDKLEDAEAARAYAEADAQGKMRFLANMSHELRTPLNAIMGFSDIMRARLFGDLPPKYAEYAELIHESGGHLLDLINDVLDVSKIEADKYVLAREQFDAREAVNAALRLMRQQADQAGVQLRGVLPPNPVEVDADRRALKQMVLNLLSNALKFTPAGGSITVTVAEAGELLELTVADNGVGIAPEDLARLGRPYEQAGDAGDRVRGTGLGLSLVKAFASLHGGDMAIESRLGEGTAVTLRLPVVIAAPAPADALAPG